MGVIIRLVLFLLHIFIFIVSLTSIIYRPVLSILQLDGSIFVCITILIILVIIRNISIIIIFLRVRQSSSFVFLLIFWICGLWSLVILILVIYMSSCLYIGLIVQKGMVLLDVRIIIFFFLIFLIANYVTIIQFIGIHWRFTYLFFPIYSSSRIYIIVAIFTYYFIINAYFPKIKVNIFFMDYK